MNKGKNDLLAIAVPFLLECKGALEGLERNQDSAECDLPGLEFKLEAIKLDSSSTTEAARHQAAEYAKSASEIQLKSDDVRARVSKSQ